MLINMIFWLGRRKDQLVIGAIISVTWRQAAEDYAWTLVKLQWSFNDFEAFSEAISGKNSIYNDKGYKILLHKSVNKYYVHSKKQWKYIFYYIFTWKIRFLLLCAVSSNILLRLSQIIIFVFFIDADVISQCEKLQFSIAGYYERSWAQEFDLVAKQHNFF